jgi:hypothetical protein
MPRHSNNGYTHNEADCLAILSACWKHRGEYQNQKIIGEWAGLSQQRVSELLSSIKTWGYNDSVLSITACKYGFEFKLIHRPGMVIDVVYVGRVTDKLY